MRHLLRALRARPLWLALLLATFGKQLVLGQLAVGAAGHRTTFALPASVLGTTLLLFAASAVLAGWRQLVAAWLTAFVATFLFYSDLVYFRQFGDLVSIATLRFAGQLDTVSGSVFALLQPLDPLYFADLLALPLVALLGPASLRTPARSSAPRAAALALVGAALLSAAIATSPSLRSRYQGHTLIGSRLGLAGFHLYDAFGYARRLTRRALHATDALAEVRAFHAERREKRPAPHALAGVARGRNVIVVQIESLQAFTLGLRVHGEPLTPTLDRLAGESLVFAQSYTQIGQGVTADADLATNCSTYPTRTGAVYFDYAGNDWRCLPTVLQERGYQTVAMQGLRADFWNLSAVYPRIGFQRFEAKPSYVQDERVNHWLSDASFFRQSAEKLAATPEPFYAFLATLSSHGPYDRTDASRSLSLPEWEGSTLGGYLHAVHYADGALGRFVEDLAARGLLDRSILVVYGDHHGIVAGNSRLRELVPSRDPVRDHHVDRGVPLLIRLPRGEGARVLERPAAQIDTAPTLLALLGIPADEAPFLGRDLLSDEEPLVAFPDGSARSIALLYRSPDAAPPSGACFDAASGAALPMGRCDELRARAQRELTVSWQTTEQDLQKQLR